MRHGDMCLQGTPLAYIFVAEVAASEPIAVNCIMQVSDKFRYREWDTKGFVARLNRAEFTSLADVSRITFVITASRLNVAHPLRT